MRDLRPDASASLSPLTVDRLVRCHRLCIRLKEQGREYASSRELGESLGYSPSQLRKDLAKLGRFGRRGAGYSIGELQRILEKVLGMEDVRTAVLVGVGDLGSALLRYMAFRRQGFAFVAAFDADPDKVGSKVGGILIDDISRMPEVLSTVDAEIGIVAVPSASAQWVAKLLAGDGVKAILNFAPADLLVGEGVVVANVDLAVEIEKLCYYHDMCERGKEATR